MVINFNDSVNELRFYQAKHLGLWALGCVCLSVKYFQVKIFLRKKIFSSVWLHYENYVRKYFQVFGCILKILFFYWILTFSQPFSQLPNKFHNRKFQYINLKETKIKTKQNKNQNKAFVKLKNSVKWREGGRENDRQLRERER